MTGRTLHVETDSNVTSRTREGRRIGRLYCHPDIIELSPSFVTRRTCRRYAVEAKFHYAVQLATRSLAGLHATSRKIA